MNSKLVNIFVCVNKKKVFLKKMTMSIVREEKQVQIMAKKLNIIYFYAAPLKRTTSNFKFFPVIPFSKVRKELSLFLTVSKWSNNSKSFSFPVSQEIFAS